MPGLIKVPVTALYLTKNFLLSGVGSYVKIYRIYVEDDKKSKNEVVFLSKIFESSVVHGIKVINCQHFIIFGGREWCLCKLHGDKDCKLEIIFASKVHDWIWDVTPAYEEDQKSDDRLPDCFAFALGHNSVLLYNWMKDNNITESHCEEKCILYSAHFVMQNRPTWKSMVLCSGTVFNQIVIWKPGIDNSTKIIERIQAHDGVIFDMHFHSNSSFLLTASDDRSIRLWGCEDLKKFSTNHDHENKLGGETSYLCKLYGHESRVWRVRCVTYGDQLYLISIGEDGYCIIWKIISTYPTDNDLPSLEAKIVRKMKCHKGRNIWSLAIDHSNNMIATGGGDGGIRLWNLHELINEEIKITKHPFIDVKKSEGSDLSGVGFLKSIHLCDADYVLGHTDAGVLLRFEIETCLWSVVNRDINFKSYAVMSVCDEFKLVAIGNTKGKMCVLLLNKNWSTVVCKIDLETSTFDGKIHNVTWCTSDVNPHIFVSGPAGELTCFEMSIPSNEPHSVQLSSKKLHTWTISIAKHRWHMGAVVMKHNEKLYVVCGDRRGSIHLFKQDICEPLHTLHGIHGKNGVSSVHQFNRLLVTTGRDGIWRKLKINFEREIISVVKQNRAAQGMDWLGTAIEINKQHSMNNFMILGFHGRNFTAWSSSTGDSLLSIECGGGHRDWSFKIQDGKSILAFVKESILHMAQVSRDISNETSVIESSFHGGQITSVKRIKSYYDESNNSSVSFLATGSEDTKIFVSAYICNNNGNTTENKLQHICTLDDHISSVRTISTVEIEDTDHHTQILLFSGGGRASINGYIFNVDKSVSWEECCTTEHVFSHNLKSIGHIKQKYKSTNNVNPETRYMDLTAWKKDDIVILAAACSDAIIRVFSADLKTREMELYGQSAIYSHCFLTIKHCTVDGTVYLITGATDGYIRVWAMSDTLYQSHGSCPMPPKCQETNVFVPLLPLTSIKTHMSGINAMDVWTDFNNAILLATGGDDNSIHLNLLSFEHDIIKVKSSKIIATAHSTQITGLRFFLHENTLVLASTSIDQRLSKWKVTIETNCCIGCEFVSSILTVVSDVSSLEVWTDDVSREHFCICGQGIQMIDGKLLVL